ncbi:MAG: MATE family efflux transporter, partial [Clostridiales bacterium]
MTYKKYFALALPVIFYQLVTISVNFVDVLMISRLGSDAIAASGICQQIYWVFFLLATGISGGMSVFIAQYWGQKNIDGIR